MQDQAQIKVQALLPPAFVALAVVFFAASDVSVENTRVYKNSRAPLEQRIEDLLARLTGKEKVSLMGGGSQFTTQPIERLSVPALRFSDGPNGVHSREEEPATVFPTGAALAASWK